MSAPRAVQRGTRYGHLRPKPGRLGPGGRPCEQAARLAFLFVGLLLLVIFLPLEFLASEFLDDNVLLTGRESKVW